MSRSNRLFSWGRLAILLGAACGAVLIYGGGTRLWARMSNTGSSASSSPNLVQNGSFEATGSNWLTPWSLVVQPGAEATVSSELRSASDTYASVTVVRGNASDPRYVQLRQVGIPISRGEGFALSFEAMASAPRTLDVELQLHGAPHMVYFHQTETLTTSWQTYHMTFSVNASQHDTFLGFNLAGTTGTVAVDSVTLTQAQLSSPTATPSPAPTAQPTASGTPTPAPGSKAGGYHVSGNQILDAAGIPFVPYGVQLGTIGLALPSWRTNGSTSLLTLDQMAAAHDFWHSNTVALKIASANLLDQLPCDASYLAVIDQEVTWAHQDNLNIILALQYEGTTKQPMPTDDTVQAWNVLSNHYAAEPWVFFDVFNEPLPGTVLGTWDNDTTWSFWQHGGTVNGTTYVGFQQLVDTIRGNGAQNLIFADGAAAGEDVALLPQHTLQGSNIVYAIHPYLNATLHGSPTGWDQWFGNAASSGNFPVVANEWGEYQSSRGECVTNAATLVPEFLSYLRQHNIGLVGYALYPGILIRGWDVRAPTAFDQSAYTCTSMAGTNMSLTAQGVGQLLVQYYAQYSH